MNSRLERDGARFFGQMKYGRDGYWFEWLAPRDGTPSPLKLLRLILARGHGPTAPKLLALIPEFVMESAEHREPSRAIIGVDLRQRGQDSLYGNPSGRHPRFIGQFGPGHAVSNVQQLAGSVDEKGIGGLTASRQARQIEDGGCVTRRRVKGVVREVPGNMLNDATPKSRIFLAGHVLRSGDEDSILPCSLVGAVRVGDDDALARKHVEKIVMTWTAAIIIEPEPGDGFNAL